MGLYGLVPGTAAWSDIGTESSLLTTREGLPSNDILRIDEDPQGNVWIFARGGLAEWRNGRLTRAAPMPGSGFNGALRDVPEHLVDDAKFLGLWRQTPQGWQRFAYGRLVTLSGAAWH
jgi:ligand-binding sensor domain-containing protein